jgi:hypothetical protein
MKILVMHQVPYRKIQYHLGIDHEQHDVTYFGTAADLAAIPRELHCHRVELEPERDPADQIIARTAPGDGYDHVLALSEFGILEAARIRAHLGIPGPSQDRLELIRDKVAMKQALAVAGVRHPRFVAAPPTRGPLPWPGRTVVKPRRGASSEGVTVHDTAREALVHYRRLPDRRNYQLEEYIEGELLHADGLVRSGAVEHLVVSRYVGRPVDFTGGAPIGTGQIAPDDRHRDFVQRAVTALGIEVGCIHLEFFETSDSELVFLEVANRLGGGGIVDSHLRRTGVHLPSYEIAARLGHEPPAPQEPSGRYHGFVIFPGHHLSAGVARRVEIPGHLRSHPCLDRLHTAASPTPETDREAGRVTYQEWQVPAFVEASHPDPTVLAAFLAECARSIRVSGDSREPTEEVVLEGAAP